MNTPANSHITPDEWAALKLDGKLRKRRDALDKLAADAQQMGLYE